MKKSIFKSHFQYAAILLLGLCGWTATNGQIITTFAGSGSSGYSGDGGPATTASLLDAQSVAVDGSSNVYISDFGNHRIRKVNTSGIISTFAGNGTIGFSGDAGPATAAELNCPNGITVDGAGNLFFSVVGSRIRKVNTSGIISTIAGNGLGGGL